MVKESVLDPPSPYPFATVRVACMLCICRIFQPLLAFTSAILVAFTCALVFEKRAVRRDNARERVLINEQDIARGEQLRRTDRAVELKQKETARADALQTDVEAIDIEHAVAEVEIMESKRRADSEERRLKEAQANHRENVSWVSEIATRRGRGSEDIFHCRRKQEVQRYYHFPVTYAVAPGNPHNIRLKNVRYTCRSRHFFTCCESALE